MPNPDQRPFSAPKNTHASHHSFEETTVSRGDKRPRFRSVGADQSRPSSAKGDRAPSDALSTKSGRDLLQHERCLARFIRLTYGVPGAAMDLARIAGAELL